jgi:undecaprenyl-diphosphatase
VQALIAFAAQYLFVGIILLEAFYLVAFHRRRWKTLLAAALVIGGLAFLASLAANRLVQDPRPFVEGGFTPAIRSSADNGFPSDHVLLLATTAAITMIASPIAGLVGILGAVVVGLARVYVGVHHLLDVFGSLVIVAFAGAAYAGIIHLWNLSRNALRRRGK